MRDKTTKTGVMGSTGLGSETRFIWDGANIVAELDGNNAVTARYIRGLNLLLSDSGGVQKFYLYNGHGDVVQLAGSNGAILWRYDYDAFGNEREIAGQDASLDGNPFRYCGEYFDKSSGTYYMRARYYQPSIGRFLTADAHWHPGNMIYGDKEYEEDETRTPDIFAIMQSNNLYVYCINSPVRYIDPSGFVVTLWDFTNVTNKNDLAQLQINTLIWDNPNSTQAQRDAAAASSKAIRAKYMSSGQTQLSNGYVVSAPSTPAPSTSIPDKQDSTPLVPAPTKYQKPPNPNQPRGAENRQPSSTSDRNVGGQHGGNSPEHNRQSKKKTNNPSLRRIVDDALNSILYDGCPGGVDFRGFPVTCFTGDTLIRTDKGLVPIMNIKVDDMVCSCDTESGKIGYKKVIELFANSSSQMVYITIDSEVIKSTLEHPFYVEGVGWVLAGNLNIGDEVKLSSQETAIVDDIKIHNLENPITVYNFTVEDYHTYFVSELEVLVHNTCTQ